MRRFFQMGGSNAAASSPTTNAPSAEDQSQNAVASTNTRMGRSHTVQHTTAPFASPTQDPLTIQSPGETDPSPSPMQTDSKQSAQISTPIATSTPIITKAKRRESVAIMMHTTPNPQSPPSRSFPIVDAKANIITSGSQSPKPMASEKNQHSSNADEQPTPSTPPRNAESKNASKITASEPLVSSARQQTSTNSANRRSFRPPSPNLVARLTNSPLRPSSSSAATQSPAYSVSAMTSPPPGTKTSIFHALTTSVSNATSSQPSSASATPTSSSNTITSSSNYTTFSSSDSITRESPHASHMTLSGSQVASKPTFSLLQDHSAQKKPSKSIDPSSGIPVIESEGIFINSVGKCGSVQAFNGSLATITDTCFGLYLSLNGLTEIPSRITRLVNLLVLDLDSNNLYQIPSEFCNLTQLTKLDVSNNKIATVSQEFSRLQSLEHLALWGNLLSDATPVLSSTKLTYLNVGKNLLSELPDTLSRLSSLQFLDFSFNTISGLSEGLGHLVDLKEIRAQQNLFENLPESFSSLTNIQSLDIRCSTLSTLPPYLKVGWGCLKTLTVPAIASPQPQRIRARSMSIGASRVLSSFAELSQTEKSNQPLISVRYPIVNLERGYKIPVDDPGHGASPSRIKLVVVGPPGAGKSSLIKNLSQVSGNICEDTPKLMASGAIFSEYQDSKSIPLSKFYLPITSSQASEQPKVDYCSVTAWEVHGKEELETLHSMFVNSRCVFVVTWNGMAPYDEGLRSSTEQYIGYWLDLIERTAAGASVMLVSSFFDELENRPIATSDALHTPMLDFFHLQEEFSSINMSGSLYVSNQTKLGIPELSQRLANLALSKHQSLKTLPNSFIKFEKHLSSLGSTLPFPVLDLPSIMHVAENCGISTNAETLYALLKLVEDSGQILLTNINYRADKGYISQELVRLLCILRPDWFANITYSLFEYGYYEGDLLTTEDLRQRWAGCNTNAVEDFRWLLERLSLLQRIDESVTIVPFRSQLPVLASEEGMVDSYQPTQEAKKSSAFSWSGFNIFNRK
eukprot:TRINITY_DN3419_c0_g1_i1.p1 TRINITY_DN3419_c0_g1~~TRINITY_DN3419_c0_g1_i1.p1  ORF type:complete len:1027 (-),score=190.27 TRINITY_DN3419_c0_g1_i1:251-3331(-)